MKEICYSPSDYHLRLADRLKPLLAFHGEEPGKWKKKLKKKLKELLGYGGAEGAPLNVRSLWQKDHEFGTIEKIVFTSEPFADVPAYVCIPGRGAPPYPFFICLQGHSTGMHNSIAVDMENEGKPVDVENDRDTGIHCMKRGVAALCIEQRGFGERREGGRESAEKHTCLEASMHSFMLGKTLLGERVFDVSRGIDHLYTRDDVDRSRIGVMGNSGGGTASVYASALLERINYSMPSCSFGTYRHSKMVVRHCPCGYVPGVLKYADMSDIMGLFAPKPVVIVAGKKDPVVPLKSVKEGFARLKRIYEAFGAGEKCKLVTGEEGHRFYADKAWPVMLSLLSKQDS